MMQQQHGGFFASVPRIVRTQYKDLSASEKWLYTCLKDLCGDRGTCFRNLRTLSIETSLSTGSLSTMIPNLHKAGLIHAEKKPRGLGGKEVWHISIVDIWQSNAAYCSNSEQLTASRTVQELNNKQSIVQNMNEEAEYCSNSEPSCSNFDDRRRLLEEERIEEDRPLRAEEQITEPFLVPTLSLRDDEHVHKSSYSHEPAAPSPNESEWLWESEGETDIFSEDADPTEKRPAVSQGGNLAPREGRARSESEDRREGSNEHPAIKPTGSRQPPASPGQAARMIEQPTAQSTADEKPRQPTRTPEPEAGTPPLPDKTMEKGNRKNGKNPTGTAALKATLTTEEWRRFKRWTSHYNARRGGEPHVDDKSRAVEETDIIKLIRKFSDERIEALDTRFFEKDPYWSKLENKYSVDGRVVWTRHQTAIPVLIEQGKWPREPGDIPMPAASSPPNGKYHPYTRASMYDPIEIGV